MIVAQTLMEAKFPPGVAARVINQAMERGMNNIGKNLTAKIGASMKPGKGMPSSPGSPPNVQSGNLRGSLDWVYRSSGNWHAVTVSAGGEMAPYARIQERGGTIYAKNAGALTIPVNAQAKAASARGQSARNINGLFLVNRPGGTGLLAKKSPGHNGGLDVWYLLRKSVTLPARPFMKPGLDSSHDQIVAWFVQGARRVA